MKKLPLTEKSFADLANINQINVVLILSIRDVYIIIAISLHASNFTECNCSIESSQQRIALPVFCELKQRFKNNTHIFVAYS